MVKSGTSWLQLVEQPACWCKRAADARHALVQKLNRNEQKKHDSQQDLLRHCHFMLQSFLSKGLTATIPTVKNAERLLESTLNNDSYLL